MKKQITRKNKDSKRKSGTHKKYIKKTKTQRHRKHFYTSFNIENTKRHKTHKRKLFYGGELKYELLYNDGTTIPKIDEMFYEDDTTYEQLREYFSRINSNIGADKITFERSDNSGKSYRKFNSQGEYNKEIPENITHIRVNMSAPSVDTIAKGIQQGTISFDSSQKVDVGYLPTLSNTTLIKKTIHVGNRTYDGMMIGNSPEGNKGYGTVMFNDHPNIVFEGHWDEQALFTGNDNKLISKVDDNRSITYKGKINEDLSGIGEITYSYIPNIVFEGQWDESGYFTGNNNKLTSIIDGNTNTYIGKINNDLSGVGTVTFSNRPELKYEGSWGSNGLFVGDKNRLTLKEPTNGNISIFEGEISPDFRGHGNIIIQKGREKLVHKGVSWDSEFRIVEKIPTNTQLLK